MEGGTYRVAGPTGKLAEEENQALSEEGGGCDKPGTMAGAT